MYVAHKGDSYTGWVPRESNPDEKVITECLKRVKAIVNAKEVVSETGSCEAEWERMNVGRQGGTILRMMPVSAGTSWDGDGESKQEWP